MGILNDIFGEDDSESYDEHIEQSPDNHQNHQDHQVHQIQAIDASHYELTAAEEAERSDIIAEVAEIEKLGIRAVSKYEMDAYIEALKILKEGTFIQYCADVINDYHAGDHKLVRLFLRGALRASFSSRSALLHFATTGRAGGGKNDILNNVTALLPENNVVMFASITARVLSYSLRVPTGERNETVMDPYHYLNKIIVVSEIADSSGYEALKAFAELDEDSQFTHSTTNGGKQLDLTITGPRSLWITSVPKIGDEQIDRRFLHSVIEPDTVASRREKIHAVTNSLINQATIMTDPRLLICKAGYIILFGSHPFLETPEQEAAVLVTDLNMLLAEEGCSPSAIKQTYALMECSAVEKQFQRGYVRVEVEDVLEGWYLSGFCQDKEVILAGKWYRPKKVV